MELYKWYKGTELPNRECDCVVIFRAYGGNALKVKMVQPIVGVEG